MDGAYRRWAASLLLHLHHHRDNLASEARPDEQTSVDQQALALKRGLDRFAAKRGRLAVPAAEALQTAEWFEKVDELLVEKDGLQPRQLLEKLSETVDDMMAMLVSILRSQVGARIKDVS
jgi:hypothetical protein